MAMSRENREEADRAFYYHNRYHNSTGSLTAASTPKGMKSMGRLADDNRLSLSAERAEYVVYSYATPIGWVIDDSGLPILEKVIPRISHSNTTAHHQSILRGAWPDHHDGTREGRAKWLTTAYGASSVMNELHALRRVDTFDVVAERSRPKHVGHLEKIYRESAKAACYNVRIQDALLGWVINNEDVGALEFVLLSDLVLQPEQRALVDLLATAWPEHHDGTPEGRAAWLDQYGRLARPSTRRRVTDPFGLPFERPDGAPARVAR
jgi:hypothetical protein